MAAINSNVGGGHTFDPSKRIRATLGDDFVSSVQEEAIERLAEAMATNAKKSDGATPETEMGDDNMGKVRDMFNNIKHTTPRADQVKAGNAGREESRIQEMEKEEIGYMPTKMETFVRATTGFGIKDSKKHNISQFVSNVIRNGGALVTSDIMETTFKYNRYSDYKFKNISIASGVSSAIDFASTYFGSANINRVTKLITETGVYDYGYLTLEDSEVIKKVINKEKLIYAAEHTAASVILPTVAKLLINKYVGEDKIEKSNVLKYATSFGSLSTVSKLGLTAIRNITEKKTSDNPTDLTEIAKTAAKVSINEQIDPTLVGTIAGSIIGYNSVEFQNPTKAKLQEFKSKMVVPVAGETMVIPVEEKPVEAPKVANVEEKTSKPKTTKAA